MAYYGNDWYEVNVSDTDPNVYDTDGDGIPDGWESAMGLDPNSPDSDDDGIPDGEEHSDTDLVNNLAELNQNSNPMDPNDSTPHPYIMTIYHLPKPGWVDGMDMGLNQMLGYEFTNIRENTTIGVIITEGEYTIEEFSVRWENVLSSSQSGDRTVVTGAQVEPSSTPRLIIEDLATIPYLSEPQQGADISVVFLCVDIVPDWNHDRKIALEDENQATDSNPFRFWINDDNDFGDISKGDSDVPGHWSWGVSRADYSNNEVDGRSDLLDFFPIWLNLHDTLNSLPSVGSVTCILKQADRAVQAVYTDLNKDTAGNFLTTEGDTYGPSFDQDSYKARADIIKASGFGLNNAFLDKIKNDATKGVLMIEGRRTSTAPLVLEVVANGVKVCEKKLPLSIDGVEEMYRTVNLRNMTNPGQLPEASNNPDSISNGKNLVFVSGYQPAKAANLEVHNWHRAWLAEMFKRFYWSGSQAKYHGVAWRSDGGDLLDYQKNVTNAFCTAPVLKEYVSGLDGDVVVVAHSLGNIVVSSAIADHNMNVSKYMLCNAAVAAEAYDSNVTNEPNMVNDWWSDYSNRTWAANWYQLFRDTGDSRTNLTWRNRLRGVVARTEVWNFYSDGDEVYDLTSSCGLFTGTIGVNANWWFFIPVDVNINLNFGRHSWQKQEMFKGTRYSAGWSSFGGTAEAGWGYESTWVQTTHEGTPAWELVPTYTNATGANAASDENLRNNPVFKHSPSWLIGSNTLSPEEINFMLAMGIPALTPSVGRSQINTVIVPAGRQNNLNDIEFKPNDWPSAGHSAPDANQWLHNDIKNVGYIYNYKLYDNVTDGGDL